MPRWPWVSRRAFDLALEERDRLRAQNETLTEQIVRIARRGQKMPENTPKPGRKTINEPMPAEVLEAVEAWDSPIQRQLAKERALQVRRETGSWDRALKEVQVDFVEVSDAD